VTVILVVLLAVVGAVAYFKIYRPLMVWKDGLSERRRLAVHDKAKARHEAKRPLHQTVHTFTPDRIKMRILRYRPQWIRGKRVRIAVHGLFFGRLLSVRVSPTQHIACVGRTQSGKSSTLRILGAWALAHPDWDVVAMDGKHGASVAGYRGHAVVLDTMEAIEDKLRHLVGHDFPLLGKSAKRRHTVLIVDESRIFNELSPQGLADLVSVMQMGHELGVHVWAGMQDFKTSSVPSEIRSQFACKIGHSVTSEPDSHLIYKELATAGWRPDRLTAPGQVLVWEPGRRIPHVRFGLWLPAPALASMRFPVNLCKATRPRAEARPTASVRPSGRTELQVERPSWRSDGRRTPARAPRLTDRQAQALAALDLMGSLGPAALGAQLGVDRKRAHEVLAQLSALSLVAPIGDGMYELTHEHADTQTEMD
jgi:hypothetical protein